MNRPRKILLLLTFLFLLFGCEENKEKTTPGFYSVKNDKLSKLNPDFELGIKFKAPAKWDLRSTEISRKVENRGVQQGITGKFIYDPSYVFFDDSTQSVLSLGKVHPPDSLKGRKELLNLYSRIISGKQNKADQYEANQFQKDGIRFTLFKIKQGSIISEKLIFQNKFNDLIQFEYTTKSGNYPAENEKIKQSIGSIGLL